jgi:hypothetical protein
MGLATELRTAEIRARRQAQFGDASAPAVPARVYRDDELVEVYVIKTHHSPDRALRPMGSVYRLPGPLAMRYEANGLVHPTQAVQVDWYRHPGRVLAAEPLEPQLLLARGPTPGALRIVQGCEYDPGSAAYRFHSALNEATKHASAFVRWGDDNPHCSLRQYDGVKDRPQVMQLVFEADVLHCHVNTNLIARTLVRAKPRDHQLVVRHYHGSRWGGGTNMDHAYDRQVGIDLRVGARLQLCAEPGADDLQWVPITVPVARYRALRAWLAEDLTDPRDGFRIAHSPTDLKYKGTAAFVEACRIAKAKGANVVPVMIQGVRHGEALMRKATCHAAFDSFWLGIQGSGLEAGAMGLPVIAGDPTAAALHREHVGHVPYTYANDADALAEQILRLATDEAYYRAEAARVERFVAEYHDYPAVAARYERILAKALGRDDVCTERATVPKPARRQRRTA